MLLSQQIETLYINYTDLSERPSASRDLAQFICKMTHLKDLTIDGQFHDAFYSTSSSMASSTKVLNWSYIQGLFTNHYMFCYSGGVLFPI